VARMYHHLAAAGDPTEAELALELEEPALATLGFAYEKRARLSGGAYHPILKRVDAFLDEHLSLAGAERERRAEVVLALDDAVAEAVARLKERGFDSPYLKAFVVARVNPLRFVKGQAPPFDDLFAQMTKRARAMDPAKVKSEDVARSGGPVEAEAG
jgi:ParB family transcriptional regulator, chromosome partitioning protein